MTRRLAALAALLVTLSPTAARAGNLIPVPPPASEAAALPGLQRPAARPFAQFVWDAAAGRLDRRNHVFHDPLDGGAHLLFWEADDPAADPAGPITGSGRLTWRTAAGEIVATYEGVLRAGRFDGRGTFTHRSGARYKGGWRAGLMQGQGRLHLPSGDEYVGGFAAGLRSGSGTYVDRFGTVYEGGFASCGEGSVDRALYITNHGWAAAENAVLDLSLAGPGGAALAGPVSVPVGRIGARAAVDLTPVLAGLGVNVDLLAGQRFSCQGAAQCLGQAAASGAFGSLLPGLRVEGSDFLVAVRGRIGFDWAEADGQRFRASLPVALDLRLAEAMLIAEMGEDGDPEPLQVDPFRLEVDQGAYRLPLPLAGDVFAGQTANRILRVEAPMTATAEFRVVLQLADGREVASRPVRLLYFRPNDWPDG